VLYISLEDFLVRRTLNGHRLAHPAKGDRGQKRRGAAAIAWNLQVYAFAFSRVYYFTGVHQHFTRGLSKPKSRILCCSTFAGVRPGNGLRNLSNSPPPLRLHRSRSSTCRAGLRKSSSTLSRAVNRATITSSLRILRNEGYRGSVELELRDTLSDLEELGVRQACQEISHLFLIKSHQWRKDVAPSLFFGELEHDALQGWDQRERLYRFPQSGKAFL
jgi:hypothetical protein